MIATATGRQAARSLERGVTLVELLVVLALMAVLMGLGISMYTNLGKQGVYTASVTKVLSTLNRVRNSSMTHPSAIQVNAGDPERGEENSVRGVEFVTMFASQCEPPPDKSTELEGALDRNGSLPPGFAFREGVIGQALFLDNGGAVDCGDHAAYDATEGVAVDVWVRPTSEAGGTVVRRGDGLALALYHTPDGLGIRFELSFAVVPGAAASAPTATPAPVQAKPESVIVQPGRFEPKGVVVPLDRWTRIVASYDRSNVTVAVDLGRGPVERLRQKEKSALAPSRKSHLFLGGGGQGQSFRGGIDDVRIEGVLGEAYEPFPPGIVVLGPTRRIRFVGGKLDPAYHTQPDTIVLRQGNMKDPPRREKKIVIGLEGNVTDK